MVAVLVEHGPDPAVGVAGHDRVADVQRAALDQHGRHRAAALVELCLDDGALGVLVGVGAQVERGVRGQDDRLEQRVEADPLRGGHVHELGVTAELFGDQAVLGQLGPHASRVRAFLVDLVDRHHDRHAGRLRVVQRLGCLRLHAVIGRHDEHHQVGGLGAAGTHGGERLVARGVDEGDLPLVTVDLGRHLVGADVLGDAARLARHHVRVPDGVEQLGLAVVDVTHDRDHWRSRLQVLLAALVLAELDVERLEQLAVLLLRGDDLNVVVQLGTEQLQRLVVHRLGGRDHLTEMEQHLHQARRVRADLVREVGEAGAAAQPDDLAVAARNLHAADRRRLHVVELLPPLLLRLPATARLAAGTAERAGGPAAGPAPAAGTGRSAATAATATAGTRATAAAAGTAGTAARTRAGASRTAAAGTRTGTGAGTARPGAAAAGAAARTRATAAAGAAGAHRA